MRAVIMVSGGLDSATCLVLAQRRHGHGNVLALSFDYGQKHRAELDIGAELCEALGVERRVVALPRDVFAGGLSTLVEGGPPNPTGTYDDLPEGQAPTYVPFRNGMFLAVASAVATVVGAEEVWFGAHAEDAARWAYPDCTPEFIGAMANAIYIGTYRQVRLVTPLEWMTKADVVRLGLDIRVPFDLTLSCYNGQRPACGSCPTCLSRQEAFRANGTEDPISYSLELGLVP